MNIFKKLFTSFLFVLFVLITIAQGQDVDNANTNPLQAGSKALQFRISNNFNLSSFTGSTISYKRQLSEDRARRFGLNLNNRLTLMDYPDSDDDRESSRLDLNIGIDYSWMNYTNPESNIKFFYGYGPGVILGFDRLLQEQGSQKVTNQNITYGIYGIGYAGVEWFFQSSMSLHAEYMSAIRLQLRRVKQTTEVNDNEEKRRVNETEIRLRDEGVKFGLSVYF